MSTTTRVLIVGAGPTGMVLALQLARRGIAFRIVDKASGPAQASRAMAVQARTLEFYDQLGFADEVVAAGVRIETLHVRENDHDVAAIPLKDMGADLSPYPFVLSFPQDDHERFLVGKLAEAGVTIEWDTELTSLSEGTTSVQVSLRKGDAEESCFCDYVCGCDGAHSRVRQSLGVDFPGGTYGDLFYVADVEIDGAGRTDASMNLGASTFVFRLPVRSSGMQRLIGVVPPDHATRADTGLTPTFEDIRPEVEALVGIKVTTVNWFATYHVHHRVAANFREGRCFLAGDAGHVHSPAGGQGMNTGIGDAVNLGWKLAEVLRGRAPASLLDSYESERIAFARSLVSTTDRIFQAMVGRGTANRLLRTWLLPRIVPYMARSAAARRQIFRTTSQTRITYRKSALSAGVAGRVRGGDRLPWVAHGPDNYEPLDTLDWQVHVYGRPHAVFRNAVAQAGLPLHAFTWITAAGTAGLKRDAAYLVRPDGHVALAMAEQDPRALADYVKREALVFAPAA